MNLKTFDLNLLRVFDALLRERSVSRVAYRVGLSQPSVSNALSRMRKLTGDPLFVRTRKGMEPTPYALQLAGPIQHGLTSIEKGFEQSTKFVAGTSDRCFTLLMSDVGEVVFLPRLLGLLHDLAPRVRLRIAELEGSRVVGELESGAADLAIGFLPKVTRGFHRQIMFNDGFVALFRENYPILRMGTSGRLKIDTYVAAAHLRVIPPTVRSVDYIDGLLPRMGLTRRIGLEIPHFMVLPSIIGQSDLVATVPSKVAQSLHDYPLVTSAPLPFDVPGVAVSQIWHARQHHDSGSTWLRGVIASLFDDTSKAKSRDKRRPLDRRAGKPRR